MKKIYTAPEANLLCFEPQENLAGKFENLFDDNYGYRGDASEEASGVIQLPQN